MHWPAAISLDGHTLWLVCASFLAGMLNSVAGGGSFFSFPALLNMGVPAIPANATNTVALWPGQFTSIAAYRKDFKGNRGLLPLLSAAAVIGGVGGALLLLHTEQGTFLHLVPWLLLVASLLFAVSGPLSGWLQRRARGVTLTEEQQRERRIPKVPLFLSMVVTTLYIGYFGAGAGFLIMALLALFGMESVNEINALKVVTTTLANGSAVVLFIVNGQVLWQHCLLMMVTGALGGFLGGSNARRLPPRLMRGLVIAVGLAMAGYFFRKYGAW
jgi:uncharacterized protein